jgi:hypothetical protein
MGQLEEAAGQNNNVKPNATQTIQPDIDGSVTPPSIDVGSIITQLKQIEIKLATVEKKLSDKWVLAVIIPVITAILTFGNYYVQRLYINSDVFKNQVSKSNAEAKSQSTSAFYKQCFSKLDAINKSFESYCNIGHSAFEDSIITATSISLTSLIDTQFPLDPKVKNSLQNYITYVNEQLIDLANKKTDMTATENMYTISKQKCDSAIIEINSAFLDPSR